ncbi:hypothetical protein [Aliikangiella coralliicola]|uniref:Uncharacterized protein n=1 Tax=Aliikangiella coralliicola TaxID=2592383 RepID=A0A545UCH3_9GAMM|nr:hypothetical protein [Aliikangiella coralliicola]TQV87123.1 hypothetical protein FLL46_15065 [Aliikangiella coralliicola]
MKYFLITLIAIFSLMANAERINDFRQVLSVQKKASAIPLFKPLDANLKKSIYKRNKQGLVASFGYPVELDPLAEQYFKDYIKDLFNARSERKTNPIGNHSAIFEKQEGVKLGIDLVFDFGSLLSDKTYIEEITMSPGTNIVDGKVRDDVIPVDTYYVFFKIDGHHEQHSVIIDNDIEASLNVGQYFVRFNRKGKVSSNDYEIWVRDKSVPLERKHKGKRPNDRIILPVDEKSDLKKTQHF